MAFDRNGVKVDASLKGNKYSIVGNLNLRYTPDPNTVSNIVATMKTDKNNYAVCHTGKKYIQTDGCLWIEVTYVEPDKKKSYSGWCNTSNLKLLDSPSKKKETSTANNPVKTVVEKTIEATSEVKEKAVTKLYQSSVTMGGSTRYEGVNSTNEDAYDTSSVRQSIINCKNAFGSPFLFLNSTDPVYETSISSSSGNNTGKKKKVKIGRVTLETIYSNPRIFSICPGKVNYLPDASEDTNELKVALQNLLVGATGDDVETSHLSGTLYDFASNYNDYMNRFNMLARASAILFGLGDVKMPGTPTRLSDYDWSYYSTDKRNDLYASNYKIGENGEIVYGNQKGIKGQINKLFENIQASAATATDVSYEYIHFFLMNESTSKNEDFNTTKTQSILAQYNDSVNSAVKNLRFLFNLTEDEAEKSGLLSDITELTAKASNNNESTLLGSFAGLAHGYLKGGTLVLPEIIDDVAYTDSISAHMKFVSPYGDKLSCYLSTIVPALALLNFVIPKQVSRNMYTYPYIIKAYQQGWYNVDLAIIENLRIERGGPDNTAWSIDGIATELDVTFDIVPLHSSMMSPSSTDPLLFMSNTPLIQYLGNLCGLDLKSNLLATKFELFDRMLKNAITDVPSQSGRQIGTWFGNKFKDIFTY